MITFKNTFLVWISLSLIFISQIQEEINEEAKQFGELMEASCVNVMLC